MKCFFILLPLFIGCSFYDNRVPVTVSGLGAGRLIFSSENYYEEVLIDGVDQYTYDFYKGEYYAVNFYPLYNRGYSRYPLGAFVGLNADFVTVSPHLGILTESVAILYKQSFSVVEDDILALKKKIYQEDDPWIFDKDDILLYLTNSISLSSVSKKPRLKLSGLNFFYKFYPENSLFYSWYQSIQCFYDPVSLSYYRVEVYADGTFTWFQEL